MEVTTVNSADLKRPKKRHRASSKRARDAARSAAYHLRLQMVLAANPETHQSADSPLGHPEQGPSSKAPFCALNLAPASIAPPESKSHLISVNSADLKRSKKRHRAPSKCARDAARAAAYHLRLQMVIAATPETHQSANSPPDHPEQEPSSKAPFCAPILPLVFVAPPNFAAHWISSTKKALGVFTRLMRSCVTNSNQLSNTYQQYMHIITKSFGKTFNRLGGTAPGAPNSTSSSPKDEDLDPRRFMYQVLYNLEQMLVSKTPIQLSLLMELCSLKRSEDESVIVSCLETLLTELRSICKANPGSIHLLSFQCDEDHVGLSLNTEKVCKSLSDLFRQFGLQVGSTTVKQYMKRSSY